MAGIITQRTGGKRQNPRESTQDPLWFKLAVLVPSLIFISLFILLPLVTVFYEATKKGIEGYLLAIKNPDVVSSIKLTLLVAAIVVPLNTIFGLAAAWTVARFQFPGRRFLNTLIEMPLWVSPVIGGLIYVIMFGAFGWFGPLLKGTDITIIFAVPGIVLATLFVTFPFVARTVIPQMEAQGQAEEQAAMSLGASGWRTFFLITIPKIKWGLLYGIILCNARSMGEFGAVYVVSGRIRGSTVTMPLMIEILDQDFKLVPAFAVASLLCILAVLTLILKTFSEWRSDRTRREALNEAAPA